jgi:hypothetical protein
LLTAHFSVTELPKTIADSDSHIRTGAVIADAGAFEVLILNTVPQPYGLGNPFEPGGQVGGDDPPVSVIP